jgi:AraC-like DNA-binding protein
VAAAAGYAHRTSARLRHEPPRRDTALLLYCVNGGGWCELLGRVHPVRLGDLVVLPPGHLRVCSPHVRTPWSVHWVEARGDRLPDYLRALGATLDQPVLRLGDDPRVVSLFHEVRRDLEAPPAPANIFHAAHALGHLLSVLIQHAGRPVETSAPGVRKVAAAITHMTEHVEQPLKIRMLADLAGLSPSYFTVLFRQQTGCAPRAYLHLLRMHRAVEWLSTTALPVKEIAGRLGYGDPFHFSRQFKAFSGLAPRDYRSRGRP